MTRQLTLLLSAVAGLDAQTTPVAPSSAPPVPAAGDPLYAPIATLKSQTLREKFTAYTRVTVGPREVVTPAFTAALRMARPPRAYPDDWKHGGEAFGKNYGNALARASAMQTGRFLTGAVLREDFRYRPATSRNPLARTFHAVGYTFFDRSDSGRRRLALANFAGAASEGFIGRLYLPRGYDDLSHAESRMALSFGALAARNLSREFAPELLKVARALHVPFPRVPVRGWWVKR